MDKPLKVRRIYTHDSGNLLKCEIEISTYSSIFGTDEEASIDSMPDAFRAVLLKWLKGED